MKSLKEVNKEIQTLNGAIDKLKNDLLEIFERELLGLMTGYNVTNLFLPVSNHEFNDGNSTSFNIVTDCIRLKIKGIKEELDYQDGSSLEDQQKAMDKISEFLNTFDNNNFYEYHFGECYDEIKFSVKDGKIVTAKY